MPNSILAVFADVHANLEALEAVLADMDAQAISQRVCLGDIVGYAANPAQLKNGITTWIHNWKARGWRTAAKQPVKNVELWEKLDRLNAEHAVHWRWVKGHAGDPGNERADALANRGVDEVIAARIRG